MDTINSHVKYSHENQKPGWYCTRSPKHPGPCELIPFVEDAGVTPPHEHIWDWEYEGDYSDYGVVGVGCSYTWMVPPSPRGMKPRRRVCSYTLDMDEIIALVREAHKS